ncbi:MAG TPA: hypothetical protein VF247_07605 [Candidatus Krumholzibacteria bacterium]
MPHPPRMLLVLLAGVVGLTALAACSPKSDVAPRSDFDRAVERFVAGDYKGTVERMEKIAEESADPDVKQEAYAYIGRAHMALGETEAAITAFTLGAHYGDRGPCIEYLEMLKQYVEGDPKAMHVQEAVTRSELAGAIVRMMDETATEGTSPGGPTPLEIVAQRGWMPATPDGAAHADAPVTRAALYVIVSRILAGRGRADQVAVILPGGYEQAARSTEPVSGAEALAILERVRLVPENHGR